MRRTAAWPCAPRGPACTPGPRCPGQPGSARGPVGRPPSPGFIAACSRPLALPPFGPCWGVQGYRWRKAPGPVGTLRGTGSRARVLPSAAGMGAAASAHASHPPSRSGWLAEAVTLLSSAGTSPGRQQCVVCPLRTLWGPANHELPLSHGQPQPACGCSWPKTVLAERAPGQAAPAHGGRAERGASPAPVSPLFLPGRGHVTATWTHSLGNAARPSSARVLRGLPRSPPPAGDTLAVAARQHPHNLPSTPPGQGGGPGVDGGPAATPRQPGPRGRLPSCRKSALQAGGGALWAEGKGAGGAGGSARRNPQKGSGWGWAGASRSEVSRSASNGSAVETPERRAEVRGRQTRPRRQVHPRPRPPRRCGPGLRAPLPQAPPPPGGSPAA